VNIFINEYYELLSSCLSTDTIFGKALYLFQQEKNLPTELLDLKECLADAKDILDEESKIRSEL